MSIALRFKYWVLGELCGYQLDEYGEKLMHYADFQAFRLRTFYNRQSLSYLDATHDLTFSILEGNRNEDQIAAQIVNQLIYRAISPYFYTFPLHVGYSYFNPANTFPLIPVAGHVVLVFQHTLLDPNHNTVSLSTTPPFASSSRSPSNTFTQHVRPQQPLIVSTDQLHPANIVTKYSQDLFYSTEYYEGQSQYYNLLRSQGFTPHLVKSGLKFDPNTFLANPLHPHHSDPHFQQDYQFSPDECKTIYGNSCLDDELIFQKPVNESNLTSNSSNETHPPRSKLGAHSSKTEQLSFNTINASPQPSPSTKMNILQEYLGSILNHNDNPSPPLDTLQPQHAATIIDSNPGPFSSIHPLNSRSNPPFPPQVSASAVQHDCSSKNSQFSYEINGMLYPSVLHSLSSTIGLNRPTRSPFQHISANSTYHTNQPANCHKFSSKGLDTANVHHNKPEQHTPALKNPHFTIQWHRILPFSSITPFPETFPFSHNTLPFTLEASKQQWSKKRTSIFASLSKRSSAKKELPLSTSTNPHSMSLNSTDAHFIHASLSQPSSPAQLPLQIDNTATFLNHHNPCLYTTPPHTNHHQTHPSSNHHPLQHHSSPNLYNSLTNHLQSPPLSRSVFHTPQLSHKHPRNIFHQLYPHYLQPSHSIIPNPVHILIEPPPSTQPVTTSQQQQQLAAHDPNELTMSAVNFQILEALCQRTVEMQPKVHFLNYPTILSDLYQFNLKLIQQYQHYCYRNKNTKQPNYSENDNPTTNLSNRFVYRNNSVYRQARQSQQLQKAAYLNKLHNPLLDSTNWKSLAGSSTLPFSSHLSSINTCLTSSPHQDKTNLHLDKDFRRFKADLQKGLKRYQKSVNKRHLLTSVKNVNDGNGGSEAVNYIDCSMVDMQGIVAMKDVRGVLVKDWYKMMYTPNPALFLKQYHGERVIDEESQEKQRQSLPTNPHPHSPRPCNDTATHPVAKPKSRSADPKLGKKHRKGEIEQKQSQSSGWFSSLFCRSKPKPIHMRSTLDVSPHSNHENPSNHSIDQVHDELSSARRSLSSHQLTQPTGSELHQNQHKDNQSTHKTEQTETAHQPQQLTIILPLHLYSYQLIPAILLVPNPTIVAKLHADMTSLLSAMSQPQPQSHVQRNVPPSPSCSNCNVTSNLAENIHKSPCLTIPRNSLTITASISSSLPQPTQPTIQATPPPATNESQNAPIENNRSIDLSVPLIHHAQLNSTPTLFAPTSANTAPTRVVHVSANATQSPAEQTPAPISIQNYSSYKPSIVNLHHFERRTREDEKCGTAERARPDQPKSPQLVSAYHQSVLPTPVNLEMKEIDSPPEIHIKSVSMNVDEPLLRSTLHHNSFVEPGKSFPAENTATHICNNITTTNIITDNCKFVDSPEPVPRCLGQLFQLYGVHLLPSAHFSNCHCLQFIFSQIGQNSDTNELMADSGVSTATLTSPTFISCLQQDINTLLQFHSLSSTLSDHSVFWNANAHLDPAQPPIAQNNPIQVDPEQSNDTTDLHQRSEPPCNPLLVPHIDQILRFDTTLLTTLANNTDITVLSLNQSTQFTSDRQHDVTRPVMRSEHSELTNPHFPTGSMKFEDSTFALDFL